MNIEIREVRNEEKRIVKTWLRKELVEEWKDWNSEEEVDRIVNLITSKGISLIALVNKTIVGYIDYFSCGNKVLIGYVIVSSKVRRRNIGTKLVKEVIHRNSKHILFGYTDTLSTWIFWQKLGFVALFEKIPSPLEHEHTPVVWFFNKKINEKELIEAFEFFTRELVIPLVGSKEAEKFMSVVVSTIKKPKFTRDFKKVFELWNSQ